MSIGIDTDIREQTFGDFDRGVASSTPRPALDFDCDRGVADLVDAAIAGDFVADTDRAMKHHSGDSNGYRAAAGAAGGDGGASEIHLADQPAAENVAVRIGVGGHGD